MSLSRKQWEEMWKEIITIERIEHSIYCGGLIHNQPNHRSIQLNISRIKDKIEQVIGQMRTSPDEL